MKKKINVKKLMADARASCYNETFIVLERNSVIKIGAGFRIGAGKDCQLFIEISLKLCPGKSITNTVSLEKSVQLAKSLKEIGYELTCEEGEVYFEKIVSESEMNQEYELALKKVSENGLVGFENAIGVSNPD